jgi:hypothetical protein
MRSFLPLTGWIICFNFSSMFQSIGREKSQGKGCRHRHNPYWGILETKKSKNGIHGIFTAPQAKKETRETCGTEAEISPESTKLLRNN